MLDNKRQKLKWYGLMLAVALLGGAWIFLTRVADDNVVARAAAHVNFRAPEFSLPTLDKRQVALNDFRDHVVLVNFWATWCPPCRTEMPLFESIYQAHRDENFVILAIDVSEDDDTVARFVQEFKLTFPILLDRDGAVLRNYQVGGLPTSFFVDRHGIIRATYIGAMNRSVIESEIATLGAAR